MMQAIKNTAISFVSYLSGNLVPPNTPMQDMERMKAINHMASSKFYIVFTSVLILAFFYFASLGIMFFIPNSPEFIAGFVTIFSKTIEILAIIIASYVGAQAVVDLKYGSSSAAAIESVNESINNVTVIETNIKEDDYELR
jgi:hypothetical protein